MARILIADDAKFMRLMLRQILEKEGFEVFEAGNGREAFTKYVELKPDLVTMDITMPDISGLEAVKLIRSVDDHAKIIMVSAMGQHDLIIEAIQAGAMDFIVKPFEALRVIGTIRKALNQGGGKSPIGGKTEPKS